jgi:hypothetical protein
MTALDMAPQSRQKYNVQQMGWRQLVVGRQLAQVNRQAIPQTKSRASRLWSLRHPTRR